MFRKTVFDYIKKYGGKTFNEKEFTEIDNIIFSVLPYLNFNETDINNIKNPTIEIIGKQYLKKHTLKEVSKYGFSAKDAYKILTKIIDTNRYKNIILYDYVYNNKGMQFSALTFKISKKLIYISFEGTDQFISSWKESFNLLASFLVPAHYEAIKYVNKHIKLFGPKVIIGGHSKGGNLALVSSIYTKFYKRFKIKTIYNNDGPGLRIEEFKSKKYQKIKNKYIQFIPNNSMIGILLRNKEHCVIKSKALSFFSHSMSTWCIDDDKFIRTNLFRSHHNLEKRIIEWTDNHTDEERREAVNTIFDTLERCGIEDTMTLVKFKSIIKIIKELKGVDKDSKGIAIDFLEYNFLNKKNV